MRTFIRWLYVVMGTVLSLAIAIPFLGYMFWRTEGELGPMIVVSLIALLLFIQLWAGIEYEGFGRRLVSWWPLFEYPLWLKFGVLLVIYAFIGYIAAYAMTKSTYGSVPDWLECPFNVCDASELKRGV